MDAETFREGIFALNTRRFGTVAEVVIKRLVGASQARSLFHDLYDDAKNRRIEVKFSRALKKAATPISESTVLRCIQEATSEQRMLTLEQSKTEEFDCNIQQVKRVEFEVLYYGVFFADCLEIFRIQSADIGPRIFYSDKQHKGNVGEGQFHINQDTIQIHLDSYAYKSLTYDELIDLLR